MSVRRYEYGEREPKWDALIALARLYGMSPGELLDLLIGWKTAPVCKIDSEQNGLMQASGHAKNGNTMDFILCNTVIVTNETGYELWQNNYDERPEPILERRSIEKAICNATSVPSAGDELSDPLWGDINLKASMVTCNDDGYCKVFTTPFYIIRGSQWDQEFVDIVNKHGWELKSVW